MPTASARNWMQASVPAVGQDVTGVRLFDRLAELPVMSEFGAPVSDEVKPAETIAGGNAWPLHGIWVLWQLMREQTLYPDWLTREIDSPDNSRSLGMLGSQDWSHQRD